MDVLVFVSGAPRFALQFRDWNGNNIETTFVFAICSVCVLGCWLWMRWMDNGHHNMHECVWLLFETHRIWSFISCANLYRPPHRICVLDWTGDCWADDVFHRHPQSENETEVNLYAYTKFVHAVKRCGWLWGEGRGAEGTQRGAIMADQFACACVCARAMDE